MKIENPRGATPLTPEDLQELIPSLSTQGELNEFESRNIQRAEDWARGNTRLAAELLTVGGLVQLHKRMYGETWEWAGRYRTRATNIGIDYQLIPERLPGTCGTASYWIENQTFSWLEIAVRFHHELVFVHPWLNGNGRHARLAADLLLEFNGQPRLRWGGGSLANQSARRDEYIDSLQEADRGDFDRLLRFAQST